MEPELLKCYSFPGFGQQKYVTPVATLLCTLVPDDSARFIALASLKDAIS